MSRFRVALKRIIAGGIAGSSLYFWHQNDYSFNNIGLIRFARVGVAATSIFVDYKWTLSSIDAESDDYKRKMKECHLRGAERLLEMAKRNGGVFIKVGQHISSLHYLVPKEYTDTLSILLSKAPESNFDEISAVFRRNIKRELNDVFSSLNQKPCGAASLAQVYEATIRGTNERVAVKIQHPKVKARSFVDLATMEFFTRCAAALFPEFRLSWLVDETKKNLPKELDFSEEAKNANRVREMFSHLNFLKIPKIYSDLSTDEVLTMEYCDGGQVDDIEYFKKHNISRHNICQKLGKLYSEMIFVNGYIHCDPHPGNVLVRRNAETGKEEIVLLDHGLYSELDENLRINYANLWLALMRADKDEIQRICTKMGLREYFGLFACIVTLRSWKSITQGMTKVKITDEERADIKEFASNLIPQISIVLDIMPRQMLLILKTNDLLRAISYRLNVQDRADSFLEMTRYCTLSIYNDAIGRAQNWGQRLWLRLRMYSILTQIFLYQKYLSIVSLFNICICY